MVLLWLLAEEVARFPLLARPLLPCGAALLGTSSGLAVAVCRRIETAVSTLI